MVFILTCKIYPCGDPVNHASIFDFHFHLKGGKIGNGHADLAGPKSKLTLSIFGFTFEHMYSPRFHWLNSPKMEMAWAYGAHYL